MCLIQYTIKLLNKDYTLNFSKCNQYNIKKLLQVFFLSCLPSIVHN